jgi:hypothetical protein
MTLLELKEKLLEQMELLKDRRTKLDSERNLSKQTITDCELLRLELQTLSRDQAIIVGAQKAIIFTLNLIDGR